MPFINEYGRIWLLERINKLTEREQLVITLRFGLDDPNHEKMTLRQIGEYFGLGRERIRQIEAKALRKLAHPALRWRWMTERLFIERCLRLDL